MCPDLGSEDGFSTERSEYVVLEDEANTDPCAEDLTGLDALHVYHDANRTGFAEECAEHEVGRTAQERWLKEQPPVPQDIVIKYWRKPSERSGANRR